MGAHDEVSQRLRDVFGAARGLETRACEEESSAQLLAGLVPRAQAALELGLGLLAKVVDVYEEGPPGGVPELTPAPAADADFGRELDAIFAAGNAISDLCLAARIELKGKRQALSRLTARDDRWGLLSACASARRKLLKSANAIDIAIAEREGSAPVLGGVYETELARSLLVRRAYTTFRHVIAVASPADGGSQQALRAAAVAIAVLVGRDVYEDLRIDDRMQVRAFQGCLIEALQRPEPGPPRAAMKLWQDLFAFSGMLVEVNNRAELREHDRGLVATLLPRVRQLGDVPLDGELAKALAPLWGRDDGLDRLLRGAPSPAPLVADVLADLASALCVPASPSPAPNAPVSGDASR